MVDPHDCSLVKLPIFGTTLLSAGLLLAPLDRRYTERRDEPIGMAIGRVKFQSTHHAQPSIQLTLFFCRATTH